MKYSLFSKKSQWSPQLWVIFVISSAIWGHRNSVPPRKIFSIFETCFARKWQKRKRFKSTATKTLYFASKWLYSAESWMRQKLPYTTKMAYLINIQGLCSWNILCLKGTQWSPWWTLMYIMILMFVVVFLNFKLRKSVLRVFSIHISMCNRRFDAQRIVFNFVGDFES